jgi:DNA-binding MarR family transcriptional regulator
MVDITMPDGVTVRFPDEMSETQIRGLIASKYPREVAQQTIAAGRPEKPSAAASRSPSDNAMASSLPFGLGDIAGSISTGARNMAEGTVGMVGDIPNLLMAGSGWLAKKLGEDPAVVDREMKAWYGDNPLPTTGDVHAATTPYVGPSYQPATTAGEVAKTGSELSGVLLSPGGAGQKVATWAGATAGNEGAGRLAKKYAPDYESYARIAGTILGGGAGSLASSPKSSGLKEAADDLGVKSKDLTRVIQRMQQDGYTPEQIRQELARLGDEATLMDVGPNLRQEGQRIVATGGEGRATITNALNERDAGANARINADIDANLGPAPVPSRIEAQIAEGQGALSPAYTQALGQGSRVDTQAIANQLDSDIANLRGAAQQQARRIRDMLNVTGTDQLDPNPGTLLAVRQAIDDLASSETGNNALRVLGRTRADIDRELARAVPGIKDVDAQFAELARQRDALGRGQQTLDSGRTAPRPVEVAEEFTQGALPQGTQIGPSAVPVRMRQGNRAEIDRLVGTTANNRTALKNAVKGEGSWNRDRMATLYGQEPTDRVISTLDRESTFADTSNRVVKNSATAERMADGSQFGIREAFMAGGPKATLYAAAVRGVEGLIDRVGKRAAAARDANVANLLTETDRNRLVTALMKANGGRAVSGSDVDGAVRMMLLLSGSTAPYRAQIQQ